MFYRKSKVSIDVYACADGITRQLRDVKDPVFSVGSMGFGTVIYPTTNLITSPVNGTVEAIFKTNHFIGIMTKEGFEIIIHAGVDTIKMEGDGFKSLVQKGDVVEVGAPLLEVDFDKVRKNGYSSDILLLLHGPREKTIIIEEIEPGLEVKRGDLVFKAIFK